MFVLILCIVLYIFSCHLAWHIWNYLNLIWILRIGMMRYKITLKITGCLKLILFLISFSSSFLLIYRTDMISHKPTSQESVEVFPKMLNSLFIATEYLLECASLLIGKCVYSFRYQILFLFLFSFMCYCFHWPHTFRNRI